MDDYSTGPTETDEAPSGVEDAISVYRPVTTPDIDPLTDERVEQLMDAPCAGWEVCNKKTFPDYDADVEPGESRPMITFGVVYHRGDPKEGTYQTLSLTRKGDGAFQTKYKSMYDGYHTDWNVLAEVETFDEALESAIKKMQNWDRHSPIRYSDEYADAEYAEDLDWDAIPEDERDYRHHQYLMYLQHMLPRRNDPMY